MRSFLIFLGLPIILTGCSHLILHESDSTAQQSAKVAARVPLGLITLGLSELRISQIKDEKICQEEGGWYFMGGCRENSEANRNRAMFLMPGLMNATTQTFNRPIQAPIIPPPALSQPVIRPPITCTTQTYGTQTYTNCY